MDHKSVRSPASSGKDARVVRTAQALREAMLALLDRKPLDQITIREIAAEAGISYATFFRHHPSKEALLDHVAADQIDTLVEFTLPILDATDSGTSFVAMVTYVEEHRALWTALLAGGAAGAMREEWLAVSRRVAAERAPVGMGVPVELAIICTNALIMETIAWWLSQPVGTMSIAQVADILHRLVLVTTKEMAGEGF